MIGGFLPALVVTVIILYINNNTDFISMLLEEEKLWYQYLKFLPHKI